MFPYRLLAIVLSASMAIPAFAQAPARKDLLGDPLPEGAISRMGSGRLRATTGVTCLNFTPDGKFIVSGSYSNKLTFWSVATGKIDKEWTLTASSVNDIQFDKTGKTVAVSGNDGTVRILDGATGAERRQLVDQERRYGTVYGTLSPDGKWLVVNNRDYSQVTIFEVDTGVLKHRIVSINAYNRAPVIFTPDSKHFVSLWSDYKIHLVEVATGKSVRNLEASSTNSNSSYNAMTLSADGKKLVYRSYADRNFRVVDVSNGTEIKKLDRGAGAMYASNGNIGLTPNGRFIVECGGDAAVRVWGIASGKVFRELAVPGQNVSLQFSALSPDGKLVASAFNTSIFLWDIASGNRLHGGSGHSNAVTRLAFTPDGKYLVSAGSSSMRVWDAPAGKELFHTQSNINGHYANYLEAGPDKSIRWVGYDRSVYRWQFDSGRDPVKSTTPRAVNIPTNVQATSPDGKTFAVLDNSDHKVKLLDNIGNAPVRELAVMPDLNSNGFAGFAFSPDSSTLAVISSDRSVTFYDVATASETRKLMPDPTNTIYHSNLIQFSPDSRMLLKYDGEMRVVESATGSDRIVLSREPGGAPTAMNCSADGRLVARGFADGVVLVTDIWTGRDLVRRETGQGSLSSLALSRDGKYLATGGANTTAMVWELPPVGKLPRPGLRTGEADWGDLAASDAGRSHRAMLHLIATPDDTARLFADRLKPGPPVDAKHIEKLVADLDHDDYKVRDRATDELSEIGILASVALKKAARSTSLEVQRRARDLLRRIEPGASIAPERLRIRRAVEVLERIGTPAARAVLETMLKSKLDATFEASIRESLGRLRAAS